MHKYSLGHCPLMKTLFKNIIIVGIIFISPNYLYINKAIAQTNPRIPATELAIELTKTPAFRQNTEILFFNQNHEKKFTIESFLKGREFLKKTFMSIDKNIELSFATTADPLTIPFMEFIKINPTKYRIRIHQAKSDFPLVFSESFHRKWHFYLVPWSAQATPSNAHTTKTDLSNYSIIKGNEQTQATSNELKGFIEKGLISSLKTSSPNFLSPHYLLSKIEARKNPAEPNEIDFIS